MNVNPFDGNADCTNSDGSYYCSCKQGQGRKIFVDCTIDDGHLITSALVNKDS